MRKIKSLLLLTVVGAMFASCSSDAALKEENEKLKAENEQLVSNANKDSVYIVSISAEMDELYANLDSMRQREERIRQTSERMRSKQMGGKEGGLTIDQSISELERLLTDNQRKIASLQSQLAKSNKENKFLKKTIEELNKIIQDKDGQIAALKVQITELQNEVEGWKSKYALTTAEKDSIQNKLTTTESELNTVFYVIGKKKDLEDRGLIDTRGLFKKVDGVSTKANDNSFTRVDTRYLNEIPVGSYKVKNIELLPKRPENSYKLEEQGGEVVLKITDAKNFWKNKYLVIVVK